VKPEGHAGVGEDLRAKDIEAFDRVLRGGRGGAVAVGPLVVAGVYTSAPA
jgi:hypothetical protein